MRDPPPAERGNALFNSEEGSYHWRGNMKHKRYLALWGIVGGLYWGSAALAAGPTTACVNNSSGTVKIQQCDPANNTGCNNNWTCIALGGGSDVDNSGYTTACDRIAGNPSVVLCPTGDVALGCGVSPESPVPPIPPTNAEPPWFVTASGAPVVQSGEPAAGCGVAAETNEQPFANGILCATCETAPAP